MIASKPQKLLQKLPHLNTLASIGTNRWQLNILKNQDIRADIFEFAVANQLTLLELKKETFSVEDVFQKLTK